MVLSLVERAELIASDARAIGLWDEDECSEFLKKVIDNKVEKEFIDLIEKEIHMLKGILSEEFENNSKSLH